MRLVDQELRVALWEHDLLGTERAFDVIAGQEAQGPIGQLSLFDTLSLIANGSTPIFSVPRENVFFLFVLLLRVLPGPSSVQACERAQGHSVAGETPFEITRQ